MIRPLIANWIGQAQQGGGIPTLVWVLIILVIVILMLWWLGRTDRAAEKPVEKRVETLVEPVTRAETVLPPPEATPVPAAEVAVEEEPAPGGAFEFATGEAPPLAPLAEEEPPAAAPRLDDLEVIEGIGPKIASILREAGIDTFVMLAQADVAELRKLMLAHNLRIADPTTWPQQAQLAAEGKWEEFKQLTDGLRGGRRINS